MISALYKRYLICIDPKIKEIIKSLLDSAMLHYMESLKKWLFKGTITDFHNEFLVNTNSDFTQAKMDSFYFDFYWNKKYIMNNENIPEFFHNIAEQVLFIGKSVNIIKECGQILVNPFEEAFSDFESKPIYESELLYRFSKLIEEIFNWTSQHLMTVIVDNQQFIQMIKSIKRVFLLENGDFYAYFFNSAEEFLKENKNLVNKEKLQSILDNCLRLPSVKFQPNIEIFDFYLSSLDFREELDYLSQYTDILRTNDAQTILDKILKLKAKTFSESFEDIKVIESLSVKLKLSWPLNMIITQETVIKYNLIFRHLIYLKYLEYKLSLVWQQQQSFGQYSLFPPLKLISIIRTQVLSLIRNISNFAFNDVIEPEFKKLEKKIFSASSIDQIKSEHDQYLDNILSKCLISNKNLLNALHELMYSASRFADIAVGTYKTCEFKIDFPDLTFTKNPFLRKKQKIQAKNEKLSEIFESNNFYKIFKNFLSSFEKNFQIFFELVNESCLFN